MLYAGFCFLLPHTPPKDDVKSIAVVEAFGLLKKSSVMWLVVCSILVAIIHNIYFMQAFAFLTNSVGMKASSVGPAMSIGQVAEVGVMAILGLIIAKLGIRGTLALGGLSYVIRFGIWAIIGMSETVGDTAVTIAVVSQGLHGFSFACFFACAFIYIDRISTEDIRHSAQAVFGIAIIGIGPILSGPVLTVLTRVFGDGAAITNFPGMWGTLSVIGLVATLILLLLFKDESDGNQDNDLKAQADASAETA